MAATDPNGEQTYWFNGVPFVGLRKATSPPDEGQQQYWFDGQAAVSLYAAGGGPPPSTNQNIVAFFLSP